MVKFDLVRKYKMCSNHVKCLVFSRSLVQQRMVSPMSRDRAEVFWYDMLDFSTKRVYKDSLS